MTLPSRGHETIDHTADMGIRGWGETLEQAFEEVADAMIELSAERERFEAAVPLLVECKGKDLTELLIEFLNALIGQADRAGLVLGKIVVESICEKGGNYALRARAMGAPFEDAREALLVEVKAATYYKASVKRTNSGSWVAQCVVDL